MHTNFLKLGSFYYFILTLLSGIALPTTSFAGDTTHPVITKSLDYPLTRITDKIYVIYGPMELPNEANQGFRNNPVLILTSTGVVVCDPGGSASAGQMIVRKAKQLSDLPIVAVFDSHAHGDHWLGNEAIKTIYPKAVIYGHPAAKAKIDSGDGQRWLELINRVTNNTAQGTRVVSPDKTVNNGDVIKIGDTTFRIYHTGIAHTEGDILVEIVEEHAMFIGDIARNHFLGVMESDSSFKGNIEALNFIITNKGDLQYYIPGHGKAGTQYMLREYNAYLSTLYNKVKTLYSTGMADYEMKPQVIKSLQPYQAWEGFDIRIGAHISQAYLEVESNNF